MKEILNKILNCLKKFNNKIDKAEDSVDLSMEKVHKSKFIQNIEKFFANKTLKTVITVIQWVLFAGIAYLSISFISHPFTFILFISLAILVMPTFNNFLRKKEIHIAVFKKWILFILILLVALFTAPIDENGNMYPGIEGIDFLKNNNNTVVLNDENLEVVQYAVNYYFDNVLVSSEKYEANLYDVITFYEDKSQNGKYELVTENNFPLEINSDNLKDNIINIYYRTVHATRVETTEAQVEPTPDTENVQPEETIVEEVEWSQKTITASTYEEVKEMLRQDVDSSTKNVVYTVEYVFDGEIDDSLTDYFVVPVGSQVNDAELKEKDGFVYDTTENCPLTVNDNKQKIKVKYKIAEKTTEEATEDATTTEEASTEETSTEASE